ncbi:hypothetical protein HDU84_000235 [Entophlyctis sp. JEL0112]|nr:hypothetical protein HDU84_000235 [Entophlyctis sp. JEL0112]
MSNNDTDTNPYLSNAIGLRAAFTSFALVGILCTAAFCTVRTWFAHIYSPRRALDRGRPPKLPPGMFAWAPAVWSVKESFILRTVGLDGVMVTATLPVLGLGVVMPTNYFSADPAHVVPNKTAPFDELAALKALTIENVPYNSPYLRVHLLFTWLFSLFAYACLIAFYRTHVNLKHHYASNILKRTSLSKIEYRSIVLFNLPPDLQEEVDLASYFEGLELGHVESVVVCRQWYKLREAVRLRMYYLQQIERLYAACMRNGWLKNASSLANHDVDEDGVYSADADTAPLLDRRRMSLSSITDAGIREIAARFNSMRPAKRPVHHTGFLGVFGKRVDSADFYIEKYLEADALVQELRLVPEDSPCTSVAFVTFDSPQSAVLASQIRIQKRPFACIAKMAPEPRDIYWPNLSSRAASASIKLFRNLLMNTISILIFLSSILWVAFSSVLPNWTKLPVLQVIFEQLSDGVKDFLQQVVPVKVKVDLPPLLVICQLQGFETVSWIEQAVFSKYYTHQIFNILLYIAGLTIWRQLLDPSTSDKTPLDIVGDLMPKSSSQIIAYVLIHAFALAPAQLLHVGPLCYTWMVRTSPWSHHSPRDTSDAYFPSLLTSLNYGMSFTVPAVIWVVGLTYSCIAPLILPFCTCYFGIAYFVNKYILLYIHVPKYETGGMHVPMVVTRLLCGMAIFQVTMMGVLAIKYGGSWNEPGKPGEWSNYAQMVIGVLPLLFVDVLLYWWFQNGYEKLVTNLPMEVLGKIMREFRNTEMPADAEATSPSSPRGGAKPKRSRVFGATHGAHTPAAVSPAQAQSTLAAESLAAPSERTAIEGVVGGSRFPGGVGSYKSDASSLMRRASQRRIEQIMSIVSDDPEVTPLFDDPPAGANGTAVGSPSSQYLRPGSNAATSTGAQAAAPLAAADGANEMSESTSTRLSIGGGPAIDANPHIEPPTTRVPGILDAPFVSGAIPKGDEQRILLGGSGMRQPPPRRSGGGGGGGGGRPRLESIDEAASVVGANGTDDSADDGEDLQNFTYIHPAQIGRLPVAWLPASQQPPVLAAARRAQTGNQRTLVRRIIGMQRAGVAVHNIGDGEADDGAAAGRGGVVSMFSLRPLIDGIMGWAYMSM